MYEEICGVVGDGGQVLRDEPMSAHTTFRAGGPAKVFAVPGDSRELGSILGLCRERGWPWFILGNGSNLLVSDEGFDGVMVAIGKPFGDIRAEAGGLLYAGAGALLSRIARSAMELGLTGLEFASGIPGSLGGAVVMNAGAYGGEMKDVLSRVQVLTGEGKVEELSPGDLELGYRTSNILKKGYVVLGAWFCLKKGGPDKILARMEELAGLRRQKQPLEYPSAGSTFKRPEGYFAGKLIQDAGLRGFSLGDAQVSEKHCGFVVNKGHASASDIMGLCRQVSGKVKERFGVELELEIKCLGNFGYPGGGKG